MSSTLSILHLPVLFAIASCGSPEETGPGPSTTATGTNTVANPTSVAPTTGPAASTSGPVSPVTSSPSTSAPATSAPATSAPATTSGPEPVPGVSYAQEVEPIFVQTCVVGCHVAGGFGGPGGSGTNSALDLSQGVGFTELTTKMSLQETSMPLVGDTLEQSYLWIKLNNLQTNGTIRMPFGVAMAEADLAKVRSWIEGGAQP